MATPDRKTDSLDKNPILHSTRIDIIRHGECQGGAIFRGSTDVQLTELGLQQMRSARKKLTPDWDVVISSPMQRCQFFASELVEELTQGQGLKLELEFEDRLKEMHFGDWDGQEIEHVWQEYTELVSGWRENPEAYTPPNGEPLNEVHQRVLACYQDILSKHAGKNILLVTHGGIIRVILACVLQLPIAKLNRFEVPYACVSSISVINTAQGVIERLHAHNL